MSGRRGRLSLQRQQSSSARAARWTANRPGRTTGPVRVPVLRRMPTSWPNGRTSTTVTTPARSPRSASRASWTNTVSPRRRASHWNLNITPPAAWRASRMRSHGSQSHHCGVGVGALVESPGNICRHRQQRRSATSVSSNRASDVPADGRPSGRACRGDLVDGGRRAVRCQPLDVVLCRAGRANGGVRCRPERHGPRRSRAVGPAPVPVTRRRSRR